MQAESSAKSIFKVPKIGASEWDHKIAELQKENAYLVVRSVRYFLNNSRFGNIQEYFAMIFIYQYNHMKVYLLRSI